jgi:hypothetical protein
VKPAGTDGVEQFAESARLSTRRVIVEQRLLDHAWNGPHGRNA